MGDYPPPYGGISVQVSTLRKRLLASRAHRCRVLDIGESRRQRRRECRRARNGLELVGWLLWHAAAQWLIHVNTCGHNLSSWLVNLAGAVAGLLNGRTTVLSLGSGTAPDWIREVRGVRRLIVRLALSLAGTIECRNERARAAVETFGVPAERIVVLSAFYGVDPVAVESLPDSVEAFLRWHAPVVGAIASIGPEYGLPLVAEAVDRLRHAHPRVGLLLMGPASFEHAGLDGGLLVAGELGHDTALAVMQRLDVFVRPTYFDGDASSVREALALGVPVIASDTDFRPAGVVLFRRGEVDDLTDKLRGLLAQPTARRRDSASEGSWPQLVALYKKLSRGRRAGAMKVLHQEPRTRAEAGGTP